MCTSTTPALPLSVLGPANIRGTSLFCSGPFLRYFNAPTWKFHGREARRGFHSSETGKSCAALSPQLKIGIVHCWAVLDPQPGKEDGHRKFAYDQGPEGNTSKVEHGGDLCLIIPGADIVDPWRHLLMDGLRFSDPQDEVVKCGGYRCGLWARHLS